MRQRIDWSPRYCGDSNLGLRNYARNSKERLLIAARTIENNEDRGTQNEYKKRKKNERKT